MGKRKRARASEKKEAPEVEEEEQQQSDEDRDSTPTEEKNLYEILGVDRSASQHEIKKAYHKLALRLHPDKNLGNEEAKEKFQQLQKVISILGDEEKRSLYDQTGCADDDGLTGDIVEDLNRFLRTMHRKITEADIEEFKENYRGSDSEKKDLIDLYSKYKGNMKRVFCSMLCSDPKLDSHRFKDILDEAIDAGELKSTKAYVKWAKKISQTEPPTSPLRRKENPKKESEDMYAIISGRRSERKSQFDSMFSSLVSRYGGGATEPTTEPTDEEFEAAQRRLERKRSRNSKHK